MDGLLELLGEGLLLGEEVRDGAHLGPAVKEKEDLPVARDVALARLIEETDPRGRTLGPDGRVEIILGDQPEVRMGILEVVRDGLPEGWSHPDSLVRTVVAGKSEGRM